MIKYLHSRDPRRFSHPSALCAWPESRVALILRDPEINACKETANDKNTLGTEKGRDRWIEVKNERFFVGVASLLQGRLNCVARGESVLSFIILLAVAPLRSGLNSKDGESL